MRNLIAILAFFCQLTSAHSETPISPAEFERLVTGQTLSYSSAEGPFGAEEYLPNRRVRWSYLNGVCQEGWWYDDGPQICFVYEGLETHQCWQFFTRNGRLLARFENNPEATELYETSRMEERLYCKGPDVGV